MAAPFLQISDVDPDPHGSGLYKIPSGSESWRLKNPGQKKEKIKNKLIRYVSSNQILEKQLSLLNILLLINSPLLSLGFNGFND